MFSQRFPALEQGTPKIMSKTTFKFDKWSYKSTEDQIVKKQATSVQAKRLKSQQNFKQIRVFKAITQKTLSDVPNNPTPEQNWEEKYNEKVSQLFKQVKECSELQDKNTQQEQLILNLERKLLSMNLLLDNMKEEKQSNDVHEIKKKMHQVENELKDQLHRTEQQLRKTLDQGYAMKDKFQQFEIKVKYLQQQTIHLHQSLLCKYCNKLVNGAVTIIPCAHTYCGTCTKGYHKKCFLCGDESKIEATYYNQFMEEIVKMYDTFQCIIKIFLG